MSDKIIKGCNFENFSEIWQQWASDPLQGVSRNYERYRFWSQIRLIKNNGRSIIIRSYILKKTDDHQHFAYTANAYFIIRCGLWRT